jgi:hypothetical protein
MAVAAAALALSVGVAMAQQGGGRGGGGWGGGGGRPTPEQMRQWRMQRYQEALGASDEDWVALEPLVSKVTEIQDAGRARGGFMFGGRRGRRGGAPQPSEEEMSPVQKAAADLQATLEDENASAETIQEQLTAYRTAREKSRQELVKAQEELRGVLTVRQEAQCVLLGLLE